MGNVRASLEYWGVLEARLVDIEFELVFLHDALGQPRKPSGPTRRDKHFINEFAEIQGNVQPRRSVALT